MIPLSFNSLLIVAGISVLVPVVLGLVPRLPVPGWAGNRRRPAPQPAHPAGRGRVRLLGRAGGALRGAVLAAGAGNPADPARDHFLLDVRRAAAAAAQGR